MSYDENDFMRLDSASEESQRSIEEQVEDDESACTGTSADDDGADNKIMEYLLNGYALASLMCPSCRTPLIKNFQELEKASDEHQGHVQGTPVSGVPFCVACKAVVVTNNKELQTIWKNEYKYLMGIDGAVHLDIDDEKERSTVLPDDGHMSYQFHRELTHDYDQDKSASDQGNTRLFVEADEEENGKEQLPEDDEVEETASSDIPTESNMDESTSNDVNNEVKTQPKETDIDVTTIDYKKRRKIATKVLGAKMIEGYSLQDTQCKRCSMPLMERPDIQQLECVVCPVLEKKVKKEMEKQLQEQEELRKREESRKEEERLRKDQLQRELERERKLLFELQTAKVANFDDEEKRMLEEIRAAREARAREEERLLAEEKQKQLRNNDEERKRLIEELRIAKQERELAMKEFEKEKAQQKEMATQLEKERAKLINELRVSKEKMKIESERRRLEAKEAEDRRKENERLLSLKFIEHQRTIDAVKKQHEKSIEEAKKEHEKKIEETKKEHEKSMEDAKKEHERNMDEVKREYEKTMAEFKRAQAFIKNEAWKRSQELQVAEQRARETEEQLNNWRKMTEVERKLAEDMRAAAEERLLDAEESIVEAEELTIEAQNARAMGNGDRSRIYELLRQAEQLRRNAEVEEAAARQQLQEAERRLENFERMRRMDESRLANDLRTARGNLELTKTRNSRMAKADQQKLRVAEDMMLQARYGENFEVGAAGEDWEARRLLGKKVLAKKVMEGWTVLPEYCSGRMCNFTPLISKGKEVECVVCEGSGNGKDGFYDEIGSDALLDETMSFISRKNRFAFSKNLGVGGGNGRRDAASREVGRRIMDGWQLLDRPCKDCQMPLMSETFGAPEVCVFCETEEQFVDDDLENASMSSRQSITIDIPDNFDPSDPTAMAALISKATSSIKSGRGRQASERNRIPRTIGGQRSQRSMSRDRVPVAPLPRRPSVRSRSPAPQFSPEKRSASPSVPRRSESNTRRTPESGSIVISTNNFNNVDDDDDTSQLSDDVSVARSVASHSLDAILSKIEDCKAQLKTPVDNSDTASIAKKSEAASLVEKLTAAALAVKKLEISAE